MTPPPELDLAARRARLLGKRSPGRPSSQAVDACATTSLDVLKVPPKAVAALRALVAEIETTNSGPRSLPGAASLPGARSAGERELDDPDLVGGGATRASGARSGSSLVPARTPPAARPRRPAPTTPSAAVGSPAPAPVPNPPRLVGAGAGGSSPADTETPSPPPSPSPPPAPPLPPAPTPSLSPAPSPPPSLPVVPVVGRFAKTQNSGPETPIPPDRLDALDTGWSPAEDLALLRALAAGLGCAAAAATLPRSATHGRHTAAEVRDRFRELVPEPGIDAQRRALERAEAAVAAAARGSPR